jgi:hypothetical protein
VEHSPFYHARAVPHPAIIADQQERELRWKKVNEDIELRSEGIEPLLDSLSLSFLFFYII